MLSYRITKYNPKKRDESGVYKDMNEWTSIIDVGNPEYGNISYEEYENVENSYIEAIRLILLQQNIDTVKVDSFESNIDQEYIESQRNEISFTNLDVDFHSDIEPLKNGFEIGFWEIDKVVKLILREIIWMNLISEKIKIIFGYDYYMYVECEKLKLRTIIEIDRMGLFLEENVSQREIIVVDENGNPI